MITCKSPVAVMRAAHELGATLFDERAHKFARKDFTLPQLFACLVLREHQKKSYRGAEALLTDCSDLRAAAGLSKAPDHNTLWRAFVHLVKPAAVGRALDLMVADAAAPPVKPAALDGTHFESRHVSRHFERRLKQSAKAGRGKRPKKAGEAGARPPPRGPEAVPDGEAAAEAVDRGRHVLPPDPGRPGDDRRRVRPPALRAADVRRLAAGRRRGGRGRRRVRLGGQPPGRPARHGGRDGHPAGRRAAVAGRAVPGRDAGAVRPAGARRDVRPAVAGRDGQQHDQAEPGVGPAATTARRRSMELLLRVLTHNIMVLEGTGP